MIPSIRYSIRYFNPRSRGGSDIPASAGLNLVHISIHAPAEGATYGSPPGAPGGDYFNPRSRGGSDWRWAPARANRPNFNPRSRGGSDRWCHPNRDYSFYFNPRSRGGSDSNIWRILPCEPVDVGMALIIPHAFHWKNDDQVPNILQFFCEPPGIFMYTSGSQIRQLADLPG